MLQVNPNVQDELETRASTKSAVQGPAGSEAMLQKATAVRLAPARKANQSPFPASARESTRDSQMKIPVFIGEVSFRGRMEVDVSFRYARANGGALNVRQHAKGSLAAIRKWMAIVISRHAACQWTYRGQRELKKGTLMSMRQRKSILISRCVAVIAGQINGDIIATSESSWPLRPGFTETSGRARWLSKTERCSIVSAG